MSFTIKCDKCGNELKLFNGDSRLGDKVQIIPDLMLNHGNGEWEINAIDIYCENPMCKNHIETV